MRRLLRADQQLDGPDKFRALARSTLSRSGSPISRSGIKPGFARSSVVRVSEGNLFDGSVVIATIARRLRWPLSWPLKADVRIRWPSLAHPVSQPGTSIADMPLPSNPTTTRPQPSSFACAHFGRREVSHVWCANPDHPHVQVDPATGCWRWMREPGADDVEGQDLVRVARRLKPSSVLDLAFGLEPRRFMAATIAACGYLERLQVDPEDCKEAADRIEAARACGDWSQVTDLDPDRAAVWQEVRDIIETHAQALHVLPAPGWPQRIVRRPSGARSTAAPDRPVGCTAPAGSGRPA